MEQRWILRLVAILCVFLVACTTTKHIRPDAGVDELRKKIHAGDTVEVIDTSGAHRKIKVAEINPGEIVGTDAEGKEVRVDLSTLKKIDVTEYSSEKTGKLALGTGVVMILAVGVFLVGLAMAL